MGALDVLCATLGGWSLLILLTGGFSVRLPGVEVSAHHLANPLALLGGLGLARWLLAGGPDAFRRVGRNRAVVAMLVGVTCLATVARLPGLFWGYRLFGTITIPHLNPDEAKYSEGIAILILNRRVDPDNPHPPGLGAQVAFAWYVLDLLGLRTFALSETFWFFAGRVVALLSGVGTVVLTYFLAREFFHDRATALLSAYFLALSSLHVTMSHIAKQDGPATFWLYATLYAALVFYRRRSPAALLAAGGSAGAAAAMKFVTVTAIPLVVAVARAPRRLSAAAGVGLSAAGAFYLLGGFTFTPETLAATRRLSGFLLAAPPYPRLLHVPLYLGFLVIGVSLPLLILAAYAAWCALPRDRRAVLAALRDDRIPLVLALVVAFVQIVMVRYPSPHYAVTLVPFIAMLAARGFHLLGRRVSGRVVGVLFGAVTLYLVAHVGSVQYYFVRDTREIAGEWIRRHVPPTEVLSVSRYAFVPSEYRTTPFLDQRYVVLHESGYRRYLVLNHLHYKFTGRFPEPREIYRPEGGLGHYPRIPQLFRGELPYRLVKRVRLEFLTPELRLARFLEIAPMFLGDTVIFEALPDGTVDDGVAPPDTSAGSGRPRGPGRPPE